MLISMNLIALTGGIASGKSTVARRLTELGAHLVDADRLAREVVEPGSPTLTRIAQTFGEDVLDDRGALNRQALADIVFEDPEELGRLNAIIHPAITARGDEEIARLRALDPEGIIVFDIPLFVEHPNDRGWDAVIVVEAPDEMRVQRMIDYRGMTRQEALSRIAHQATNEERRAVADALIDASGTIDWTIEQVDRLWRDITSGRFQTRSTTS